MGVNPRLDQVSVAALIVCGKLVGLAELEGILESGVVVEHQKDADHQVGDGSQEDPEDQLAGALLGTDGELPLHVIIEKRDEQKVSEGSRRSASEGQRPEESPEDRKEDPSPFLCGIRKIDRTHKEVQAPDLQTDGAGDGRAVEGGGVDGIIGADHGEGR